MKSMSNVLFRRALMVRQSVDNHVFVFTVRADEVLRIAAISRVTRDADERVLGGSHAEVREYVDHIQAYLDSDDVIFPNALVVAFSESVIFRRSRGPVPDDGLACAGTLEIPIPGPGEPEPAWLVDGQRRALALSRCARRDFPVPVVGFIAPRVNVQKDQFIRINSCRPLDESIVSHLLTLSAYSLPRGVSARQLPHVVVDLLRTIPESPFHRRVRRNKSKVNPQDRPQVDETALVNMVHARLNNAGGCLFPYRNMATGEIDGDTVMHMLVSYWSAVQRVFSEDWELDPSECWLLHGTGIKALGNLMDVISARVRATSPTLIDDYEREVARVAGACRWTHGKGDEIGDLPWENLDDTSRNVSMLSNYLVREYLREANGK